MKLKPSFTLVGLLIGGLIITFIGIATWVSFTVVWKLEENSRERYLAINSGQETAEEVLNMARGNYATLSTTAAVLNGPISGTPFSRQVNISYVGGTTELQNADVTIYRADTGKVVYNLSQQISRPPAPVPGNIHGNIMNSQTGGVIPLGGIAVSISPGPGVSGGSPQTAITDSNGFYTFSGAGGILVLSPGNWSIHVNGFNYSTFNFQSFDDTVYIPSGQDAAYDIYMQPPAQGNIQGRVLNSVSGMAVSGATVTAQRCKYNYVCSPGWCPGSWYHNSETQTVTTDAAGNFSFVNTSGNPTMQQGRWQLSVSGGNYLASNTWYSITSSDLNPIATISLHPSGTIYGVITDQDTGSPVEDVTVYQYYRRYMRRNNNQHWSGWAANSTKTDSEGRFSFDNVYAGRYDSGLSPLFMYENAIYASHSSYYDSWIYTGSNLRYTLLPGENKDWSGTLKIIPDPAEVTFHIDDILARGIPDSAVRLSIQDASGTTQREWVSGSTCTFTNVSPGQLRVYIYNNANHHRGYQRNFYPSGDINLYFDVSAGETEDYDLTLIPYANVKGYVYQWDAQNDASSGSPLTNLQVYWNNPWYLFYGAYDNTDSSGFFQLFNNQTQYIFGLGSSYEFCTKLSGYYDHSDNDSNYCQTVSFPAPAAVTSEDDLTQEIILYLTPKGNFKGIVYDCQTGLPLSGAHITPDKKVSFVNTDSGGFYNFALPESQNNYKFYPHNEVFTLTASCSGYKPASDTGACPVSADVTVDSGTSITVPDLYLYPVINGEIYGKVKDSDNTSINLCPANVRIVKSDSLEDHTDTTNCSNFGEYRFSDLPLGDWLISARGCMGYSDSAQTTVTFTEAVPLIENYYVYMQPQQKGQLNISVVDRLTKDPVSGADLDITYAGSQSCCLASMCQFSGVTNPAGEYSLSVPPGRWQIDVDISGYETDGPEAAVDLSEGGNENVLIELTGTYTAKVQGRVLGHNSNPLQGMTVYLYREGNTVDYCSTDVNGEFSLEEDFHDDNTPKSYTVATYYAYQRDHCGTGTHGVDTLYFGNGWSSSLFSVGNTGSGGGLTLSNPWQGDVSSDRIIAVPTKEGTSSTDLTINLIERPVITQDGYVTDGDGTGIGGSTVQYQDEVDSDSNGSNDTYTTTTDGSGYYSIDVPVGYYDDPGGTSGGSWSASGGDGVPANGVITWGDDEDTDGDGNFILDPVEECGWVEGTVLDYKSMAPLEGVTVTLGIFSHVTDSSGYYKLPIEADTCIPVGQYNLTGQKSGYRSYAVTGNSWYSAQPGVEITVGSTTTYNFRMWPIGYGLVEGRLVLNSDPDVGIGNADVDLNLYDASTLQTTTIQAGTGIPDESVGVFSLNNILETWPPAGVHNLLTNDIRKHQLRIDLNGTGTESCTTGSKEIIMDNVSVNSGQVTSLGSIPVCSESGL